MRIVPMKPRLSAALSLTIAATLFLAACGGETSETASTGEAHWIATFADSPLATTVFNGKGGKGKGGPPPKGKGKGKGGFGGPQSFENQTLRETMHVSVGGSTLRIHVSNTFGDRPLNVGSAHIALAGEGSAIESGSDHMLTFNGQPSAMIPVGGAVVSDPVELTVADQQHVAVSLFLPEATGLPTWHATGLHHTYIADGDHTADAELADAQDNGGWFYVTGLDVMTDNPNENTIVAFGDSITDGAVSTPDTDHDWPSLLGVRLENAGMPMGIANEGISGNRVLKDGAGVNALDRYERDVLEVPGAKYVIILEGINDIGQGFREGATEDNLVTADELIAGYQELIDRGHTAGLTVIGATLTPYEGAGYYSEAGEAVREQLNEWIRTSGAYDGVVDFDAAIRDPENPKRIRPDYTRDNLHGNNDGYQAMADAVDLKLFQ